MDMGSRMPGERFPRGTRGRAAIGVALVAVLALVACGLAAERYGWAGFGADGDGAGTGGKRKPNVVMIMTDDQWLESVRVMDRTREIFGDEGVTFENYYPSMPICCPSRSTFLTGQFAHNNGVRHNSTPLGGYAKLKTEETLPVWMRRAGYATSHIGKYPNGYGKKDPEEVPPGWDEWRGSVDPTTYRMWGYRLNENGKLKTYGNPRDEDPDLYQTDVYRDKAADFIKRKSAQDKPFFLDVAFLAPHGELLGKKGGKKKGPGKGPRGGEADRPQVGPAPRPAPRHKGKFADEPLPRMPAYGEEDMSDKPAFLRDYPKLGDDAETRREITASYRGRLESLLAVDEAVGKLVSTLREAGQLDNTYLVFAADNGFFFGQHNVPTGKFLPHEASGHVPMMIRGPGIEGGTPSRAMSSNVDLAATITDIGGAKPGLTLDGRSLLPYARDPRRTTDRPVLHEGAEGARPTPIPEKGGPAKGADAWSGRRAAAGDLDQDGEASPRRTRKRKPKHGEPYTAAYESLRTERYLYVRYTRGGRELYDLKTDPYELDSKHDDPAYADVRKGLEKALGTLQGCKGDACNKDLGELPEPKG
ncbi:sulfatase [Streptomyces sp. NPDC048172]|uniref:sulfatase family protein n=1 Tax=Streptomyces sp. NPDC048172 TaxID=3365505 RepID=UPI0037153F31